ncbi:4Fe-4S dicluster domain-containing protein [bacterium]|nr:4Fe-4S dicluster domain-containing protein [bacterium]
MKRESDSGIDPSQPSPIHAVKNCMQCGRCSSSCLAAFQSDDSPRKVIRLLQWGLQSEAMNSPFLRLCIQCLKCTDACPVSVDVAGVIRKLTRDHFLKGR